MADLTGKSIKSTYKDLLKIDSDAGGTTNSGLEGTMKNVTDGEGQSSKLHMSTNKVRIEDLDADTVDIDGGTVDSVAMNSSTINNTTIGIPNSSNGSFNRIGVGAAVTGSVSGTHSCALRGGTDEDMGSLIMNLGYNSSYNSSSGEAPIVLETCGAIWDQDYKVKDSTNWHTLLALQCGNMHTAPQPPAGVEPGIPGTYTPSLGGAWLELEVLITSMDSEDSGTTWVQDGHSIGYSKFTSSLRTRKVPASDPPEYEPKALNLPSIGSGEMAGHTHGGLASGAWTYNKWPSPSDTSGFPSFGDAPAVGVDVDDVNAAQISNHMYIDVVEEVDPYDASLYTGNFTIRFQNTGHYMNATSTLTPYETGGALRKKYSIQWFLRVMTAHGYCSGITTAVSEL